MKFKVGDTVKIRKDLQVYKTYLMDSRLSFKTFYETMQPYCGRETQIIRIEKGAYLLACDMGYHLWSDGMLQKCDPLNYKVMITNDEVKIYRDDELVYCQNHENFKCETIHCFLMSASNLLKEMARQKIPFNGKVICLAVFDAALKLTPGKVYEIREGVLMHDDIGHQIYNGNLIYSLNDITGALFVELEEYIKYLDSQK